MIAIDAVHGKRSPGAAIKAAVASASDGTKVALLGPLHQIKTLMPRGADSRRIELIDSKDPVRDGATLVAEGSAKAVISAGATATVVEAAQDEIGVITGIRAPALAGTFATLASPVVLLDLGASTSFEAARAEELGRLGVRYSGAILGKNEPLVGLLAPSEPSHAGADLDEADEALRSSDQNYAGLVSGTEVFAGRVDVVVTSGVMGQVLLESIEGLGTSIAKIIEKQIRGNLLAGAGALLLSRIGKSLEQKLEHPGYGAGVILGLRGLCFTVHPESGEKMWRGALRTATQVTTTTLIDDVQHSLSRAPSPP